MFKVKPLKTRVCLKLPPIYNILSFTVVNNLNFYENNPLKYGQEILTLRSLLRCLHENVMP